MARFRPTYSDDESKILIAIYENPDMSYDTYALTQLLTGITAASPDFEAAFKKMLKAIEQLIVRGLVDGKQLKGGLGMYYHELKLKYKGKQEAIQERGRIAEWPGRFCSNSWLSIAKIVYSRVVCSSRSLLCSP